MNEEPYVTSGVATQRMSTTAFAGLMEAVLEKNVPFRFTASGSSMSPFILDGDAITIEPAASRPGLGDVVAFINPACNRLMVHRIIRISPSGYLIKGDNNSIPDGEVEASAVLGRVVKAERRTGPVRFGLGFERIAIALLSQHCWLIPLVSVARLMMNLMQENRRPNETPHAPQ
jgi:signal peptidase I